MRTIVTLALFLVVGFVASRGYVARVTHRLPIAGVLATGVEFFLLGIVLGATNVITPSVISDLEPVAYLALAWVGMLFGIELPWENLRKVSRRMFRFLSLEAGVLVGVVGLVFFFVVPVFWPEWSAQDRLVSAVMLGITAAVGSPTVIAVVTQRERARGPVTNAAKVVGALSGLFPVLVFGLFFIVIRPRVFDAGGVGAGALWWVFVNVVGLALGLLVVLFTQERTSDEEMLVLTLGTLLIVGGICYYLQLSSLYTAMVAGFVVGNLSRRRDQIFRELHVIEPTLFVGFLILVGATVGLPGRGVLVVMIAYVLVRLALKWLFTGAILHAIVPERDTLPRRTGWVLSGQGVMAIAIALDCLMSSPPDERTALQPTLAVVAFAVVVHEVMGIALVRRELRHAGEAPGPRGARRR